MLHDNVSIAAMDVVLGQEMPVRRAVASGLVSKEHANATDQRALRVIGPTSRGDGDLAGRAVSNAIVRANLDARLHELGPVYHATSGTTDLDATGVMRQLCPHDSRRHPALTLATGDHAVIDALRTAAGYLSLPDATGARFAVISASDAWSIASWERWNRATPLGDGAGAVILTVEPGPLRLLATATRVDPTLNDLRRAEASPIDLMPRLNVALDDVVDEVLEDARIDRSDVRFLVTPFGARRAEHRIGRAMGEIRQDALEDQIAFGRQVGHLGAADLVATLHRLTRSTGPTTSGDHVLALADSGRGSVGAALFEVA